MGAVCALALLFLIYQIPSIHDRLAWRMTLMSAYARGVVDPNGLMPTPLPRDPRTPDPIQLTPTSTATPAPAAAQATETQPASEPTATQTPTPTPPPASVKLDAPQWEKEGPNNCGPATLTMYLRYYGWDGTQADITTVVKPNPDDRNVNVDELAYYVNTKAGWLQVQFRVGMTLESVKRFVAAGVPVMIEEAFHDTQGYWPNDDKWAGHYILITGYDDALQAFTTQDSYYGANRVVAYTTLDADWKAYNRVLIAVYLPDQADLVQSLFGRDWDEKTSREDALAAAQAETKANPNDNFAWFNVGTNQVYFEDYEDAAQAYDTARKLGLPQRMLRYQFGPFIAYFHTGRTDDLMSLVEYALKITPNSEEALLWHGWALYRKGNNAAALIEFNKALAAHPGYADATYAINFLNSQ
jgi:tetratricopeptide (TPR) repeat protein